VPNSRYKRQDAGEMEKPDAFDPRFQCLDKIGVFVELGYFAE
jgi:hypothetical protein